MSDTEPVAGPSRRESLGPGAAAAIIAVLVACACLGAAWSIGDLTDLRDRYADLDHGEREQAAGTHEGFEADDWEFFRQRLREGDRYLVVTPGGGKLGLVDQGFVTRAYAGYFLLPAVQVAARADATVVVYANAAAPATAECGGADRTTCILRLRP